MSLFERLLRRKPDEASQDFQSQKSLEISEGDRASVVQAVTAEREQSEEKAQEVLDTIRRGKKEVPQPAPVNVGTFTEDEPSRTSQAKLELEISRNQALTERLIILRDLQKEIKGMVSVNSDLARTQMHQILEKRAQMIRSIPRYAQANPNNIQDTLKAMVENGTLSDVIELSRVELEESQKKVAVLQQMLHTGEAEATRQALESSLLKKDSPEV